MREHIDAISDGMDAFGKRLKLIGWIIVAILFLVFIALALDRILK